MEFVSIIFSFFILVLSSALGVKLAVWLDERKSKSQRKGVQK